MKFHKALPEWRMRRGIGLPQWWMLLMAILSIFSSLGCWWAWSVLPRSVLPIKPQ